MAPPTSIGSNYLIDVARSHSALLTVILIFVAILSVHLISSFVTSARQHSRAAREKGCEPPPSYPHADPYLGFGAFIRTVKAVKRGNTIDEFGHMFEITSGGVKTISKDFLGRRTLHTIEPENIKTMLSSNFKDWGHTLLRIRLFSIVGHGIFTASGHAWEASRALLRPAFARSQVGNLKILEGHLAIMMEMIPNDQVIDLQQIFPLLTMDFTTDILFGDSTRSLLDSDPNSEAGQFTKGFNFIVRYIAFRGKIGYLGNLLDYLPDNAYKAAVAACRGFISGYVFKAQRVLKDSPKSDGLSETDVKERYIFLRELVKSGWSSDNLVGEAFDILGAGRDTTAALLSIFFFTVSRRPDVLKKIRQEIENEIGSRRPLFDDLKRFKYLNNSVKEIHRLHTIIPINVRRALIDTILPLGGGPDGKSPIFVPRDMIVVFYPSVIHRQKDIYGPDANEYRPERWENLQVSAWKYVPFGGGPRICIGQDMSNMTALYTIVRLLQSFGDIQPGDDSVWAERLSLSTSSRSGCKLRMSRT